MSPLLQAATFGAETIVPSADHSGYVVSDAAKERHAALQAANSVGEVIAMVPAHY